MTDQRATDLSPSGIQRLLEICDKAKRGPWKQFHLIAGSYEVCQADNYATGGVCAPHRAEDADFIEAARTALPDALREIENLTAMLHTQRAVNCSVSRGYSAIKGVNTKLSSSISKVTDERDAAHTDIDTLMQINLDLVQEIDGLRAAIQAIIDRSNNREMGTGKVPDMRDIAVKALADTSMGNPIDPASASRERIAALEAALEHVGQVGNVCVGRTLGRQCDYCACDGKNLVDAVLSERDGE